MKIAIITDDGQTISQHFGRAHHYLVFTVENGQITGQELRDKFMQCGGHHDQDHEHHEHEHGTDGHADDKHNSMVASILDCESVIGRGMGRGAFLAMEQANLRPFITDIASPEAAVQAYVDGKLVNHLEKLH
ncbi:MAG TPA: NifB/NifX family molybdenum-iron cluster-binding protein [Phototrophicaceae bacterium]|nr:NifB/NifX family molybdenum-iron cluster-binding protein [Phototrophicaceae bacterium]